jgi:hypothetical protein
LGSLFENFGNLTCRIMKIKFLLQNRRKVHIDSNNQWVQSTQYGQRKVFLKSSIIIY